MNRSDLVLAVMQRTQLTKKQVEAALSLLVVEVRAALIAGHRLEIRGFGSLSLRQLAPRRSRNPRSGEALAIGQKRRPTFRASRALLQRLNDPI